MSDQMKYATMDDVARLCGVSKGTVDRVIHNRGDVSEKTKNKVLQVIKEIGYKPNVYASLLSLKKSHKIIAVIPYFQKGEFWELVYNGIMMAETQGKSLNIEIEIIYYNQFDINSFKMACSHTLTLNPNGVLIAPIYKEETINFVNTLGQLDIPVVYIDTRLQNTNYLAYYGMPLYESGYLAAYLLIGDQKKCDVVNFNLDREGLPPNDSMLKRYQGFMAYVKDHGIECNMYEYYMMPNDFLHNMRLFDSFFEEHPNVSHILTTNSRAYMIAEWMEMKNITDKKLLGFDMLKKNLEALKKGYLTTLITEKTYIQVHHAMNTIIDYLIFKKRPLRKDNLVGMDILNKYNVDYYTALDEAEFSALSTEKRGAGNNDQL